MRQAVNARKRTGHKESRGKEREMEEKLYEAAITGDLSLLDDLLCQRIKLLSKAEENPLHTASGFGHADFIKKVLELNPSLARRLNSRRLSPLHLASSKGQVEAAKALLESDPGVCFIRDQKGRTPLHIAAEKGQVEVLTALVEAKPKAAWVMTDGGEPILHLCVNHNQLEALKVLVEKVKEKEFVNLKDDDGNTVLHLLASKNQHEVMKALVDIYKDQLDVNEVNIEGLTALDISLQHPTGIDRLKVRRILANAEAKKAEELRQPTADYQNRIRNLQLENYHKWLSKTKETLLVVAILMASVTFQAGLNPPGGVWQCDDCHTKGIRAGEAVMSYISPGRYISFMIFNSTGFVASLSLIVLLVSRFSFHERVALWALTTIIWIAVISMLLIYACSLSFLTSKEVAASWSWSGSPISYGWGLIVTGILVLVRFFRLVPWLLNTLGIMRLIHWILVLIRDLTRYGRTAIENLIHNKDTNAGSRDNP